jgi:hypothetical protein
MRHPSNLGVKIRKLLVLREKKVELKGIEPSPSRVR